MANERSTKRPPEATTKTGFRAVSVRNMDSARKTDTF